MFLDVAVTVNGMGAVLELIHLTWVEFCVSVPELIAQVDLYLCWRTQSPKSQAIEVEIQLPPRLVLLLMVVLLNPSVRLAPPAFLWKREVLNELHWQMRDFGLREAQV